MTPNKDDNGSGDPPNPAGPLIILPNPRLPCKMDIPVRRLTLENKMKVLLISVKGETKFPIWVQPLPLNSLGWNTHKGCCSGSNFSARGPSFSFSSTGCNFAVSINAGGSSDPKGYDGLAHFVEHLVHHGSKKYPGDSNLQHRISEIGGHSNAFTEPEVTCYYVAFQNVEGALQELLDRYADLLWNPTLEMDLIRREIHSIENELHLRRCGLAFRITQLVYYLSIPDEDHPLKNFLCGSLESLMPNGRSEEELREAIVNFHRDHYRPENMTLVVQAPYALDALQKYVAETFGSIKSEPRPVPRKPSSIKAPPHTAKLFNRLITIKPKGSDRNQLLLIWALPSSAWKNYKEKPTEVIGKLLMDRRPGKLTAYLHSQRWILNLHSLDAGVLPWGLVRNEYVGWFTITLQLTQEGRDRIDEVLETIFSFIRNLKILPAMIEELSTVSQMRFDNWPMRNSADESIALAINLKRNYEPEELISGTSLYFNSNLREAKKYLNELTPRNACYVLVTCDTGKTEYLTEKWYGAQYLVQELTLEILQRFETGKVETNMGWTENPLLGKISKNRWNTYEKMIIRKSPQVVMIHSPEIVGTNQSLFQVMIYSCMNSTAAGSMEPVFNVWMKMLLSEAEKNETFVNCSQLGTRVEVAFIPETNSIGLQAIGNSYCAKEILKLLVTYFLDMEYSEAEKQIAFDLAKQNILHSYYEKSAGYVTFVANILERLIYGEYLSSVECYQELRHLELSKLNKLIKESQRGICFNGVAEGSAIFEDVEELANFIESKTFDRMGERNIQALLWGLTPQLSFKVIPPGERCLRIKSILPDERPFTILHYYQLDPITPESIRITAIIQQLLNDTVMHELRTKEQLGYVVNVFMFRGYRNGMAIMVIANSAIHSLCHIDQRIDNCLKLFYETKLTRETLLLRLRQYGIIRDPEFVRDYVKKFMIDQRSKLAVQVCHEDMHNLCRNDCCHQSKWLDPLFHIGKVNSEVCFAEARNAPANGDGKPYFIPSIEAFQRFPTNK